MAIGGGFTPAQLSSILSWWDSDQGVLTDAEGVHTWQDQADSYNVTQTTGAAKPSKTSREGLTVIKFDGGDWLKHTSLGSQLTGNWTMFWSGYSPDSTTDQLHLSWGENATGKRRSTWIDPTNEYVGFSGYFRNVTSTYQVRDAWTYIVITWDGTTIKVRADGQERASGTPVLVAYAVNQLVVGANPTGGENSKGEIRDSGVLNSALSGDDLSNLESYLSNQLP